MIKIKTDSDNLPTKTKGYIKENVVSLFPLVAINEYMAESVAISEFLGTILQLSSLGMNNEIVGGKLGDS